MELGGTWARRLVQILRWPGSTRAAGILIYLGDGFGGETNRLGVKTGDIKPGAV